MSVIEEIKKDIKELFQVQDKKIFLKKNIPYLAFFYLGDIFSHHVNSYVGGDAIDRIFQAVLEIETMSYLPSLDSRDLLVGLIIAATVKLIPYSKSKNAKKFRQGEEYGSARWGNSKDIAPYMEEDYRNNLLLTETERITMNSRPKNPKYARNKNVLVIGATGERVIIVMGAVCVIKSRVSGTLDKYNSCIA